MKEIIEGSFHFFEKLFISIEDENEVKLRELSKRLEYCKSMFKKKEFEKEKVHFLEKELQIYGK